jgi:hypothetical protein
MNENRTHVLCSTNITEANVTLVSFFIYDLKNEEVIYEPNERIRKVAWISNQQIKANIMIGMPTGDGTDNYLIYDIKKKKRISNLDKSVLKQ